MVMNNATYFTVSDIIKLYSHDFDVNYWSTYKALLKVLGKEQWDVHKREINSKRRLTLTYIDSLITDKNLFNKEKENFIRLWENASEKAKQRGLDIHNKLYNDLKKDSQVDLSNYGVLGKYYCVSKQDLSEDGLYPEFSVSFTDKDSGITLAARIDLLIKKDNKLIIIDYKTNKELKIRGYYSLKNKRILKMKYPLNSLEDCNYLHYVLQLSLYQYILNKVYPELEIENRIIIHYDKNDKVTKYETPFLEKELKLLIKNLLFRKKREDQKLKRTKIQY